MSKDHISNIHHISDKIDEMAEIFNELYWEKKPIPNELILHHNKLLNDYNEALKLEKKDEN